MKFAINVPNFGPYADARLTASLAREAEQRGWDGFHVWDHIHGEGQTGAPTADPWILLAAVALATERIRIGTMVTPVARRRPWKLARDTVTLDRLSDGRLTLGVGLGYPADLEFTALGEEADDRVRAEKLDEGLDLLAALWSGESISHTAGITGSATSSFCRSRYSNRGSRSGSHVSRAKLRCAAPLAGMASSRSTPSSCSRRQRRFGG